MTNEQQAMVDAVMKPRNEHEFSVVHRMRAHLAGNRKEKALVYRDELIAVLDALEALTSPSAPSGWQQRIWALRKDMPTRALTEIEEAEHRGWTDALNAVIEVFTMEDALPPAPEGSPLDPEQRMANLFESFADDVERMSDDELIEECRANGEDPDAIAERTRGLLQATVDRFKLRQIAARALKRFEKFYTDGSGPDIPDGVPLKCNLERIAEEGDVTVGDLRRLCAAIAEADASPAKDPIAAAVNAQLDPLKDELIATGRKLAPRCPQCFTNANVRLVADASHAEAPEDVWECSCGDVFTTSEGR